MRYRRVYKSLIQVILDCVLAADGRGLTVSQVVAKVGRHIPESRAVAHGRRFVEGEASRGRRVSRVSTPAGLAYEGRRRMIGSELTRLSRQGKIRRLSRGVYGPPGPQLYAPPGLVG